jgi:ParB family transcriptional regulator, chromosome partitioning protein
MVGIELRGLKQLQGLSGALDASLAKKQLGNQIRVSNIAVDSLQPGKYQPRKSFDSTKHEELISSVRKHGVIQPLIVKKVENNKYEIVAGERRWRAALAVNLITVPAIIRDLSDETTLAFAIIENIQREDLTPLEEAEALKKLIEQFGLTHQEVAQQVGKSRTVITNLLRMLNLTDEVKTFIRDGKIEVGHAKILAGIDDKQRQISLANDVVNKKWIVRELEKRINKEPRISEGGSKKNEVDLSQISPILDKINLPTRNKVKLKINNRFKGKVEISVNGVEELMKILQSLL